MCRKVFDSGTFGLCCRVSRFSLDALMNIAMAIGRRVHVELEAA